MKAEANKKKAVKANASVATKNGRRVLGLNSSKQVEGTWYYDLNDMETVVAAVLSELDNDPGAGITLEAGDNGIVLNVTSTEGEEFTVDVDLESEGEGEPVPADTEGAPAEEE